MRSFSPTFAGDSLSALRVARLLQQHDGTCVWQLWLSHKHTQTIHSRNRQKFTLTIPVEKVALVSATCPQRPSLSRVRPSLSRVHSSLSRVRSSLRRRLPYRGGVRAVGRHALPHAALTNTGPPDHTITPPSLSHTHGHMQASLRTAALTSPPSPTHPPPPLTSAHLAQVLRDFARAIAEDSSLKSIGAVTANGDQSESTDTSHAATATKQQPEHALLGKAMRAPMPLRNVMRTTYLSSREPTDPFFSDSVCSLSKTFVCRAVRIRKLPRVHSSTASSR